MEEPDEARPYLHANAERFGISRDRIILTPKSELDVHIQVLLAANQMRSSLKCKQRDATQPRRSRVWLTSCSTHTSTTATAQQVLHSSPTLPPCHASSSPFPADALWAGVPVITLPGQHMAARVASTLVTLHLSRAADDVKSLFVVRNFEECVPAFSCPPSSGRVDFVGQVPRACSRTGTQQR